MIAGLTIAAFSALAVAIFVATLTQRLSGQGLGMVGAPVVAIIAPEHLPSTLLILGLLIGAGAISLDVSAINWREARPGLAGRAVGGFIGAGIAALVIDPDLFAVIVAIIILVAIALTLSGLKVAITPVSLSIAGATAGIMGTLTAVGAPPMAILYSGEEAKRSRAMQNLFFLWGMFWSLGSLTFLGLVGRSDLMLALALAPAAIFALIISRPVAGLMDGRSIKPYALGASAIGAVTLLWRACA